MDVTFDVEETLKTDEKAAPERVSLAWEAFIVSEAGEKLARVVIDGIGLPQVGDRLLLFLQHESETRRELFGSDIDYRPVNRDGIAFLDGDEVDSVRVHGATAAKDMLGLSVDEVSDLLD